MRGTTGLTRRSRLALLSTLSAGVLLLAATTLPSSALADGGPTIAAAPLVVYGQQEFGNTATGGSDGRCNTTFSSNWLLPVTAGDQLTIDWEAQGIDTVMNVYPLGTNDFNVGQANTLESRELNAGGRDEVVFTASASGDLPLVFQSYGGPCSAQDETGPYDFTAYVRHVVRLALPPLTKLHQRQTIPVAVHNAEGGAISDPSLLVDVQLKTGHQWLTIGRAGVSNSSAAVSVNVPRRFIGRRLSLRALAHGGNYLDAASDSRRVLVVGTAKPRARAKHRRRAAARRASSAGAQAARAAASGWSRPQMLGTSRLPAVAFAALAVGMAADGSSLTVWTHHGVHARWRSANGRLGPDQLISPSNGYADDNGVAVAPNGTAVITWGVEHPSVDGPQTEEFSRLRSPSGALGPVQDLGYQLEPLMSVFFGPSDGSPRFVWAQAPPPSAGLLHSVFISPFADPGGLLSPTSLDDPTQDTDGTALVNTVSSVAVDAQGDSLIVWVDQDRNKLFGRVVSRTGSLGPMLTIANSVNTSPEPEVALSPNGSGYVIWASGGGPFGQTAHIAARQVNLSGAMGPVLPLGRIRRLSSDKGLRVASFSDGRAIAVWCEENLGPVVGRILSSSHVGPTFRLSAQGNDPQLVAAGRQAVAVWSDEKTHRQQFLIGLTGRTISEAGTLGKPVVLFPLSGSGQYVPAAALAGNAKGQMVAAWLAQRYKAGSGRAQPGVSVLLAVRQ